MPATAPSRGLLKASQNRVRTSVSLQGNAMWENVIGVVNEQAGSNAGVEALIRAPTHGGGRRAAEERRQAAHDVVLATGGFDTAITNYQSLLTLARSQGAVGGGNERGACKVCGQLGHLTKQCRNHLSKHYKGGPGAAATGAAALGLDTLPPPEEPASSMSDLSDSSEDSEDSRRRRRRSSERRDKKSTRDKNEKKRRSKERKERKEKKRRKESSSKQKRKRSRRSSSPDSD